MPEAAAVAGASPSAWRSTTFFTGPGDKGSDHRRPPGQSGGYHGPHLLGVPGGKSDQSPEGEISLKELKGLGVGVGGPVLAGLHTRVGADQDHGPVGLLSDGLPGLVADGVQAGGDPGGDEGQSRPDDSQVEIRPGFDMAFADTPMEEPGPVN
jgi:hypothetical protein